MWENFKSGVKIFANHVNGRHTRTARDPTFFTHSVRIGSGGGKRNADNNGNVPSGTVVDTRITRNERVLVAPHRRDAQIVCYHDFYLCSQRGILVSKVKYCKKINFLETFLFKSDISLSLSLSRAPRVPPTIR